MKPLLQLFLLANLKAIFGLQCNQEGQNEVICSCEEQDQNCTEISEPFGKIQILQISNCDNLTADFLSSEVVLIKDSECPSGLNLTLDRSAEVTFLDLPQLKLTSQLPKGLTIKIENVSLIELSGLEFQPEDVISWLNITHTQLYFYLAVILAAVLFVVVFIIIPTAAICLKRNHRGYCGSNDSSSSSKTSKRVSRAESWKFESNLVRPVANREINQLPYQLVPRGHVVQLLGRSSQLPMQFGLPQYTQRGPSTFDSNSEDEEDFDDDQEEEQIGHLRPTLEMTSLSSSNYGNSDTLPAYNHNTFNKHKN